MNRKEMLKVISEQSGCSLRHVRKVLFKRAAESKRRYPRFKFNEALTNPEVDWEDREYLKGWEKFHRENTFEVLHIPSGDVVLFYVSRDDDNFPHSFGVRLWTRRGMYKYKRS